MEEEWSLGSVTIAAEIQILILENHFPTEGTQCYGNSYADAILDGESEI